MLPDFSPDISSPSTVRFKPNIVYERWPKIHVPTLPPPQDTPAAPYPHPNQHIVPQLR